MRCFNVKSHHIPIKPSKEIPSHAILSLYKHSYSSCTGNTVYIYRSYTDRISSKRNISNHANVRQKPAEIIALPLKKSQQTNKHGTETTFQPSRQFIVSNRFILKDLYIQHEKPSRQS